ncbi:DUF461 domain-containing protein [Streptomyces beijiangensis]|uniref:DUF461 domain-containing protein n=1 Tax=Streptomyces beijiangensis TaxID=163361 RepID=A0A939F3E1_9ACTN|nr:DUF461 domain-containing protein [Streptomyces beijiangensis]MBO0510968.1 DUF461 domain-containing protein [Streptomyces beijiangensis]
MSRSLRRGALAASAIVVSIASLSACGSGNDAQTLQVKPDNAATSVGDIKLQNVTVITQPDAATGPAVITGTIFNNGTGPQTLDSIAVKGYDGKVALHAAKGAGPITLPAQSSVTLGGKGNASAVIADGSAAATDGNAQLVTFSFSDTGEVPLRAFVVPARSYFEGYGPSSIPVTPKPKETPSGTPTGTASGTPSGTPEGTPSGTTSATTGQ